MQNDTSVPYGTEWSKHTVALRHAHLGVYSVNVQECVNFSCSHVFAHASI